MLGVARSVIVKAAKAGPGAAGIPRSFSAVPELVARLAPLHDDMKMWRQHIHKNPELGFEEVNTQKMVAEKLKEWGVDEIETMAGTAVVGTIYGKHKGTPSQPGLASCIGLRADMDCLPMAELNSFEHKSCVHGQMHACGHDGHTAMLLGATRYLAQTRNFHGKVRLIFQPAEEGQGGAKRMVEEGLFDKFPMEEVYAVHNWPGVKFGTAAVHFGPVMAACDKFEVKIFGKGGHAAMPHQTVDPIHITAVLVQSLQGVVSRQVDPFHPAVLSVTYVNGGDAFNVIPDSVTLGGTVRSLNENARKKIEDGIFTLANQVCESHGARAEVVYERIHPVTLNTDREAEFARQAAVAVLGEGKVSTTTPASMASEDFSQFLLKKPGCYIWLGPDMEGHTKAPLHNPHYDFNDALLPLGAAYFVELAESRLGRGSAN